MLESLTRAPKISTNWSMSISAPVSRRYFMRGLDLGGVAHGRDCGC
jgi:hypothetical protein